jgi:hypothetical protein
MQSGFVLLLRRWYQEMSSPECLKYVSKPYVDVNKHVSVYTFLNTLYNLTYTEFLFTMSLYVSTCERHLQTTQIEFIWTTGSKFSVSVRFQVLTAASMMFRVVFWDILPPSSGMTHP